MDELLVINKPLALSRLDGDEDLWREIVDICLEDTPSVIMAMGLAISSGNPEAAAIHAHKIKSAVGNIGAEILSDLALQIEKAGREKDIVKIRGLFVELEREHERVVEEANVLMGR